MYLFFKYVCPLFAIIFILKPNYAYSGGSKREGFWGWKPPFWMINAFTWRHMVEPPSKKKKHPLFSPGLEPPFKNGWITVYLNHAVVSIFWFIFVRRHLDVIVSICIFLFGCIVCENFVRHLRSYKIPIKAVAILPASNLLV